MDNNWMVATVVTVWMAACNGDTATDKTDTETTDTEGMTDAASSGDTGEVRQCDDNPPPPCSDPPTVVSGVLTGNVSWTAGTCYLLRGLVQVGGPKDPSTLSIEAGVVVLGEAATNGTLVVTQGSRIEADGTSQAPIVFTSDAKTGSRDAGDWGGIYVNGFAPLAGGLERQNEGLSTPYGGDDPADDSGFLRFVRIEFAGTLLSPGNLVPGLSLNGVGSGTEVHHVHVHRAASDGIVVRGGTVDVAHLVVSQTGDEAISVTEGWTGRGQFWAAHQANEGDDAIVFEGSTAQPNTNPTVSNLTVIDAGNCGISMSMGSDATIANALVQGTGDCICDAGAGTVSFTEGHISCATAPTWFTDESTNVVNASLALAVAASCDFTSSETGAVVPSDPFFEDVDHRGAVGEAGEDWTLGWTNYPAN